MGIECEVCNGQHLTKDHQKATGGSESKLIDLLSSRSLSAKEFQGQYEGTFETDPLLRETVKFLRTATYTQIAQARRDGLLTPEMHRDTKRILERTNR